MFENLRGDIAAVRDTNTQKGWWKRYRWTQNFRAILHVSFPAVVTYRFGHWVEGLRIPVLKQGLWIIANIIRRLVAVWTGVFIMPKADIGPGLVIHTWYGVLIGAVKIGRNCTVGSGVAITNGVRHVGDNVWFGMGAKVVGDVTIGNNVVIMPNSLVMTDVPDNTTVVGVPARIKLRGGRPQRFRSTLVTGDGRSVAQSQAPRAPATKE